MKGKSNNFYLNRDFWLEKSPEYFNNKYFLLTIFIIIIYSLYTLTSFPLYIYYHFFGDLGLFDNKEIPNNSSLNEENLNYFQINDISFFMNMINNIYTIGLAFLSYHVLKNQTFSSLGILMFLHILFIFAYLMNINITFIPHKTSIAYRIFNLMTIFCFILHFIHLVSYNYKSKITKGKSKLKNKETLIGKYKLNERPVTIDSIVNEIQLRMDMAKIKFNSFIIKLKLHKICKKIMFKQKDFYFMNKESEKERKNENIIRNIKGYKTGNNMNIKKNFNNSQISDNCSTTFDSSVDNNYSKLNDDNEYSPLNI